jgi:hypothetical protein
MNNIKSKRPIANITRCKNDTKYSTRDFSQLDPHSLFNDEHKLGDRISTMKMSMKQQPS